MSDQSGKGDDSGKLLYCSFCGKSQHEVRKLIAGPSVFICDECVELCNDIIREEVSEGGPAKESDRLPVPQEIKEILTSKGLRLGMQREEAVHAIDRGPGAVGGGDPNDPRNKPITELKLSIRARRTVENLGCLTLGEVTQHSEDELLGMPNFGVTSLAELKNKLSEPGLKLKSNKA